MGVRPDASDEGACHGLPRKVKRARRCWGTMAGVVARWPSYRCAGHAADVITPIICFSLLASSWTAGSAGVKYKGVPAWGWSRSAVDTRSRGSGSRGLGFGG